MSAFIVSDLSTTHSGGIGIDHVLFIYSVAVATTSAPRTTEKAVVVKPICELVMNVGFILDSSANVKDKYGVEKLFMKKLAASFGVSADGSKASVIAYSDVADINIKFTDNDNIESFSDAADKIPFMNSKSRIDKALEVADKAMFSLSNGAKPGVVNVLVILTTGTESDDEDAVNPASIAEEMIKTGVNIITVGIGPSVNKDRLGAITGDEANVFMTASFDDLADPALVKKINEHACQKGMVLSISYIVNHFHKNLN